MKSGIKKHVSQKGTNTGTSVSRHESQKTVNAPRATDDKFVPSGAPVGQGKGTSVSRYSSVKPNNAAVKQGLAQPLDKAGKLNKDTQLLGKKTHTMSKPAKRGK